MNSVSRASQPPRSGSGALSSREHSIGDKVSATMPDMVTAPISAKANSANSAPVSPLWKPIGT